MDFETCPDMSLGEWGLELRSRLGRRRYPFSATLEITDRCDLTCVHCYINKPAANQAAQAREMTLAEIKKILDQMAQEGVLSLVLTGGEVMLRPDFTEIYRHAKQLGLLVTIFTNGTLMTPRIADFLADWPPQVIDITLYGHTQETYEKVTGVPGSFVRCRRGIELVLERGLRLSLKTVVLSVNLHEFSQMKAFAEQLNVRFRYDTMLWPRLDGNSKPYEYRLSLQEAAAFDRDDLDRQQKLVKAQAVHGSFTRTENLYNCGAGINSFHVSSDGQMSACMMARKPAYDLRHGNLKEGWEFLGTLRERKRQFESACQTCTAGALCSQCPGWSQAVHGDDETIVDFVCEAGKLRAAHIRSLV